MLPTRSALTGSILASLMAVGLCPTRAVFGQETERTVLTRQRRVTPAKPENSNVPRGRVFLNGVLVSGNPPQSRAAARRRIYVDSRSRFLNAAEIEEKLLRDKRFAALNLEITRSFDCADLVIEVERTPLTANFDYAVVDARKSIVAKGHANSLFGTASGRIAKQVLEKLSDGSEP